MATRDASEQGRGEQEYVLGTGDDELARLGVQHRVWSDAASGAWRRAGIGVGARVLDVGCGPGYATFDLAELVTHTGRVVGVDVSPRFVKHVNQQAGARRLTQVSALVADLQSEDAGVERAVREALGQAKGFDAAYARWVLCWLANPALAVRHVAALLNVGGRFVVQDYFAWETMTRMPRSRAIDRLVEAAQHSFRAHQGDTDIAGKLPAIFNEAGLALESVQAHSRVVRGGGGDSTLAWPVTWWNTYAPKLVESGHMTQRECDEALVDVNEIETRDDLFFVCPTVYELIGRKR